MLGQKDIAEDQEEELKMRMRIRDMLVSLGQLNWESSVEFGDEELRNIRLYLVKGG